MDRKDFGLWGLPLNEDTFACALAALGVLDDVQALRRPDVEKFTDTLGRKVSTFGEPVAFHAGESFDWILSWAAGKAPPPETDPAIFSQAWLNATLYNSPRLEIALARSRDDLQLSPIDLYWLVEQLSRAAVHASSVYIRVDEPSAPVSWDWPLRIGLLRDARSQSLRSYLSRSELKRLFRIVDVEGGGDCEVLLLPSNLKSALEAVLHTNTHLSADCVLVMGGIKAEGARAQNLLSALRTEIKTSGVGILFVPKEKRNSWVEGFVAHLAHNHPLDAAAFLAAREKQMLTKPPLLTVSRKLIETARLSSYVGRLSRHLRRIAKEEESIVIDPHTAGRLRLPAGHQRLDTAAETLGRESRNYDFGQESGDATSIVVFKEAVEGKRARPVVLAQANGGGEPTAAEEVEERRIQARFFEGNDPKRLSLAQKAILGDHSYTIEVRIGFPAEDFASSPVPFRSDLLPPSAEGHKLTVAFCELSTVKGVDPKPHVAEIHLPQKEESTSCFFYIHTRHASYQFEARLIVLHENRVLQTMLLHARVVEKGQEANIDKDTIELVPETLVREGFHGLENRPRYDAAIILNHNGEGTPGIMTVSDLTGNFYKPEGLDLSVAQIGKIVSSITILAEKPLKLSDESLLKVMYGLAHHGRLMWESIAPKVSDSVASAKRIQVVEARDGAFLPVEFFYDRMAPKEDAPLCEHAVKALQSGDMKTKCPSGDDDSVICPTAFWGFSRVIERQEHRDLKDAKDYQLSEPTLDRNSLNLLANVLVGSSDRVTKPDRTKIISALSKASANKVVQASSWDDWPQDVKSSSPSLLVLLPHSDKDQISIATLEIGSKWLKSSELKKTHVLGPNRQVGPGVFLLGCSTQFAEIPFQHFVGRFKLMGAAFVLGTLSVIRGRHTVQFVKELMAAMAEWKERPDATFGDALLSAKQKMLARGDPFVLSLIAYGDAEWRL